MLSKQANIRNIMFETDLAQSLPEVYIDSNEFEQLLINLINNAFYAIEGTGIVAVRAVFEHSKILLSIRDNGIGIEKKNLEKVFLPFFTTKPVGEGTGMGLSVCYGIVRGWGGTITVDSEVGNGTVFTIVLPVHEQTAAAVPDYKSALQIIDEVDQ